eukprot:SAG22_NODE_410_length_10907_cov_2.597520_5_plen_714_part_00
MQDTLLITKDPAHRLLTDDVAASTRTKAMAAAAAATAGSSLAQQLQSLRFYESGLVSTGQRFAPLRQCAEGILESTTQWSDDAARPGTTMEYMYDVTDPARPVAPPVGMRSAVPLGGLGTGSFELRADGSIRDWSIENQGPALAADKSQNAKLPLMPEALIGVRAGSYTTALRTHDHAGLPSIPLAPALEYTGSFPFSRLALRDAAAPVDAALHAWSPSKLWDENRSATPAITFSLLLTNKQSHAINASLWLSLPLATAKDITRSAKSGAGTPIVGTEQGTTAAACLRACAARPNCTSWSLSSQPPPPPPPLNCSAKTIPTIPYCTLKAPIPPGDWPLVPQPGTSTGLPNRSASWLARQPGQAGAPHDLGPDVGWDRLIPTNYHCWSVPNTTQPPDGRASCADSCEADSSCQAWSYVARAFEKEREQSSPLMAPPPLPLSCTLLGGAPAVQQYLPGTGAASGAKGRWRDIQQGGKGLVHERMNPYLPCGRTNTDVAANPNCKVDAAAAVGSFTLMADGATGMSVRTSTADSMEALWRDFAAERRGGGDDVGDDSPDATAAHGAIEATTLIAPGETKTISVVFAWYFPERDYAGAALGNHYSESFASSTDVARSLLDAGGGRDRSSAADAPLLKMAQESAALNALIANTTFPAVFQSFLLNSLATQVKNSVWVREQTAASGLANGKLPGGTAGGRFRTCECSCYSSFPSVFAAD